MRQVDALDKPLLAAVGGPAVGAGADLALHADIRLMARTAYLRESYVDLGVVPGAGGAFVLPRLVGTSKALELLWTGRKIGAEEALELGLAARAVEADELIPAAMELAGSIAAKPLQVLQMLKRMVRASSSMPLGVALDLASSNFAVLQETSDHAEGIRALRERRSPDFHDE